MIVYTIGHSTRPIEAFLDLLREAGIRRIADVRSLPGSRAHPQFNAEALSESLAATGIDYRHLKALGGRRSRKRPDSPNGFWREGAFRNYADYAMTEEFRAGLAELEALAAERPTAIMCAEAVWWRCHRRIVTDYLIARGAEVRHVLDRGKIEAARMTEAARPGPEGTLVYPEEPTDMPLFDERQGDRG